MDYGTIGTVAGALVVGLFGGFFGSWFSTRAAQEEGERQREHDRAEAERQRAHEQRERLRERQIDAADDFLRAVAEFTHESINLGAKFHAESDDEVQRALRDNDLQLSQERLQGLLLHTIVQAQRLSLVFPDTVYSAAFAVIKASMVIVMKLAMLAPPAGALYEPTAESEADLADARKKQDEATRTFQKAAVAITGLPA